MAVDQAGRELDQTTVAARTLGHAELISWARHRWPDQRVWAVEDCRHVTGRLERDLLAAGERVVRVPPRLMAGARLAVRASGNSDPIDALAVARAALREPDLPTAGHDQASWEVKLLVDHREHLVAVCQELTAVIAALTTRIHRLTCELRQRVAQLAPQLLSLPGCGVLTAAKLIAETAGVARFRSEACFAMHAGVAPLPVSSGRTDRHRLCRGGNRQLNAAIHRIAITQLRLPCQGQTYYRRRRARVTAPVMPSAPSSDVSLELSTSSSSSPRSTSEPQLPPLDRGAT